MSKALIISVFFWCLTGVSCAEVKPTTWDDLMVTLEKIEVMPPPLDFATNYKQMASSNDVLGQQQRLKGIKSSMRYFEPENSCQAMALDLIDEVVTTEQLRLKLSQQQATEQAHYQGSIYALEQGQLWYQYLTRVWLGEAVKPDELYQIGEAAFEQAMVPYRSLNDQLLTADSVPELVDSKDDQVIQRRYLEIEQKVKQHWQRQFISQQGVADLIIARSLQDKDFPAPGYYNSANHTMYYHPMGDSYDLQQAEWLYLHEGIPGHHYQSQVATLSNQCSELNLNQSLAHGRMAFVEGWAAYVETLGQELGLLKDPRSHQVVLKWQALRAMRVMIDVGIHAKGWTDEKAQQHWIKHFPEGEDVMLREINRIKRWPMQVNSYVYGKHKIEQLKKQIMTDESATFNVKSFHQNILNISHLPIQVLNHYAKLFDLKEYQS